MTSGPKEKLSSQDETGIVSPPQSQERARALIDDIVGPSAEDLVNEARLLWEEDPELAAMLGIEIDGIANMKDEKKGDRPKAQKSAPRKRRTTSGR